MPVYEYKCECSDKIVPFTRSIKDEEPVYPCESCSKPMTRYYSPFGIQFKGNGFYKTDNPK